MKFDFKHHIKISIALEELTCEHGAIVWVLDKKTLRVDFGTEVSNIKILKGDTNSDGLFVSRAELAAVIGN